MAYPKKVKEYAKKLFLTVDENGNHENSLQDIVKKIQRKSNDFIKSNGIKKCPDKSTIQAWSQTPDKITKKSWVDLWDKGQRHGIKKAIKDAEKTIESDEEISLQVDIITRERAERAINLGRIVSSKIKNKENLENIDLKILQTSEIIFNNLNLEGRTSDEDLHVTHKVSFIQNTQDKILEEEGYDEQ